MHDLPPSLWVRRFAPLIAANGAVLDLACGSGRHTRWLANRGYRVEAVDRDPAALANLQGLPNVTTRLADVEGDAWPYANARFDGVIVTNYLHRPRFGDLLATLKDGSVLIYETFMAGNEKLGKPSNPDYLLQPGELLRRVQPHATVIAFEQGRIEQPRAAFVQRICARIGPVDSLPS